MYKRQCLESVPDESIEPLASVWVPKVDATLSVGNMWSNSRGSKRGSHQTFVLRALVPGVRRYIHYIIYRKWSSRGRSIRVRVGRKLIRQARTVCIHSRSISGGRFGFAL